MKRYDEEATLPEEHAPPKPGSSLPLRLSLARFAVGDGEYICLSREATVVGRQPGPAGFGIPDMKLSREHFRVAWDTAASVGRLEDHGSRNGTYLNGARVQHAVLREGDVIRAGDSLFVCHTPDDANEAERHGLVARADVATLLVGETGTGKERLAQQLHQASGRGPLVPVNCGALPRDLVASELFGHVRGAFSGAYAARLGLFAAAHRGTLFLDEICELPLDVQPALLRALQEGKVRAVGAEHETSVDVRIMAATNQEPEQAVREGLFRADLYARLAGMVLCLAPLRHRRHQLLGIAASIAEEAAPSLRFGSDALEALLLWDFPYNVRELKSLLLALRGIASCSQPVSPEALQCVRPELVAHYRGRRAVSPARSHTETEPVLGVQRKGALRDATDLARLEAALRRHDGHLTKAAGEASISRQRAQRLLQRAADRDPRRSH